MSKLLRPKKTFCISNASDTFKEIYSNYLNDEFQKKINIELIKHPTKIVLEEVIKKRRMQLDSERDLFADLLNKEDFDLDTKKILHKYKKDNSNNQIFSEDDENSNTKKMSKKYLLSLNGKKIKKKLKLDFNTKINYFINFNQIKLPNDKNIQFVALSPSFSNKKILEFPQIFPRNSRNSRNSFNLKRLESMKEQLNNIEIENCNFDKKYMGKNLGMKSLSQGNLKIHKNIFNIKNTFQFNPKLKNMKIIFSKLGKVCKNSKNIIKDINDFSETEQCFLDKKKQSTLKLVEKY